MLWGKGQKGQDTAEQKRKGVFIMERRIRRRDFYQEIKREIQRELLAELDFSKELDETELLEMIDAKIHATALEKGLWLEERKEMRKEIFRAMRQLDILQELIEDPGITEIMINGKDHIFIERGGRLYRWENGFDSEEKLSTIIQQIVAGCNRVVNEASPIVDARLENGSRVNVVLKPIALNGPIVTIRRFPKKPMDMETLIKYGALREVHSEFLKKLVQAGYNIMISGGTGSGKTTFLNALSDFIPKDERVITIEDSAELQITGIENLVSMETRNANASGSGAITIRDLIKSSLRMRPERIVVGEVRGGEALDMLQAMNTGHDGSLSTGHANSPADMLSRLETMALMGMELPLQAIRRQIASGVDLIVHLGRLKDGSRKVLEIVETDGMKDGEILLHTLFAFEEESDTTQKKSQIYGRLQKKGDLHHTGKLKSAGIGG